MTTNERALEVQQLNTALHGDFRQLPIAYPILARHGLMERTANGYRDPGHDNIVRRIRELIDRLSP